MKKALLSLWFILSAGMLMFLALYGCFTLIGIAEFSTTAPITLALAADAVMFFLLRRHIEAASRFLFILSMAIISGVMAGILFLGIAASISGISRLPILPAVIILILTVLMFTILLRRRPVASLIATLILILLAVGPILTMSAKQRKIVGETEERYRAAGLPLTLEEVFPLPSTKSECAAFLDAVESIDKKNAEKDSIRDRLFELNQVMWKALSTGENLKPVLDAHALDTHPEWENLVRGNEAVLTALSSCPYVQVFDPKDYTDNIQDAPIPNLLAQLRTAKSMAGEALIFARQGNFDQARKLAFGIGDMAKKFEVPGQFLINNLIAIAMQKIALTTIVAIESIEGVPMPEVDRQRARDLGRVDPTWAESILDAESYDVIYLYRECRYSEMARLHYDVEAITLPLWRTLLLNDTKADLGNLERVMEWYHGVPEFDRGLFHWHDVRKWQTTSYGLLPDYSSFYKRLVILSANARMTDAVDQLLAYHAKHRKLPDSPEQLDGPWPLDPFVDKPLTYVKIGERDFIVSSVGPDEKPGDPGNLYIFGILEKDDPRDIGYHVVF